MYTKPFQLTIRQRRLLEAILAEPELDLFQAADTVPVKRWRVGLWMNDPNFIERLEGVLKVQARTIGQRQMLAGRRGRTGARRTAPAHDCRPKAEPEEPQEPARADEPGLTSEQFERLMKRCSKPSG